MILKVLSAFGRELVVTISVYALLIRKQQPMKHLNYTCPKCNHREYTVGQMRATGGTFSKIFDVQTEKYTSVTCQKCTFTEFYKSKTSAISNIFDLFTG
ncbi:MAG: putative nucleic-acid-binding Zn-ribbon protein [Dokdonia sp.]|jgi:predicted nucleic-acid-binding Zn-ribbon protein